MSRERSYAAVLGSLQKLDKALEANKEDLARFQGAREMIQEILAQGHEVAKQQAALVAAKQEMSLRLRTLIADGQRVATAVRALLKKQYGLRSEKLAEFGVQPFRGRAFRTENRGRHTPTPAASETPAPQPAVPAQSS